MAQPKTVSTQLTQPKPAKSPVSPRIRAAIDKSVARSGAGTVGVTPESIRQSVLNAAGITAEEQAKLIADVWQGIKDGLKANDKHVSVVGNSVETTIVPNHTARAKARDQALDIVGIRAPRVNSTVRTSIKVRVEMPDWAKPAEDKRIIDVSPASPPAE